MRVFVVVDSQQHFHDWCARNRVHPAAAVCVIDLNSVRGQIQRGDIVVDARITQPTEAAA